MEARARAKQLVQKDALGLEQIYQEIHADEDPPKRPPKPETYVRQTVDCP